MSDAKADAALYLLTGLMQRLSTDNPDLAKDMLEGIRSDRAAVPDDIPDSDYIDAVFIESIKVLERIRLMA